MSPVAIFLMNAFLQMTMKLHSQSMKTVLQPLFPNPQSVLIIVIKVESDFIIL